MAVVDSAHDRGLNGDGAVWWCEWGTRSVWPWAVQGARRKGRAAQGDGGVRWCGQRTSWVWPGRGRDGRVVARSQGREVARGLGWGRAWGAGRWSERGGGAALPKPPN
jgi:hypothetical protein